MTVRHHSSPEFSDRRLIEWVDELTPYIRMEQRPRMAGARRKLMANRPAVPRGSPWAPKIGWAMTIWTLTFLGVLAPALLW